MKLTSNHLAGAFTHNQELVSLIIIMLIELVLNRSHLVFVLICNWIILILKAAESLVQKPWQWTFTI